MSDSSNSPQTPSVSNTSGPGSLPQQQQHPLDAQLQQSLENWTFLHNARIDPLFRVTVDGQEVIDQDSDVNDRDTANAKNSQQGNQTQQDPKSALTKIMRKAYWDSCKARLLENFDDGIGWAGVFERIVELMDSAAVMFSKAPKGKQDEVFGPMVQHCHQIQSQIRSKTYGFQAFVETLKIIVESLLSQLESPYQHQRTQKKFNTEYYNEKYDESKRGRDECATELVDALAQVFSIELVDALEQVFLGATELVDALAYLFLKIDICKAELKNFRLAMLTPFQKAANERQQFEKIISSVTKTQSHPWVQDFALKKIVDETRSVILRKEEEKSKEDHGGGNNQVESDGTTAVGTQSQQSQTNSNSKQSESLTLPLQSQNSSSSLIPQNFLSLKVPQDIAFFRSEEALFRYIAKDLLLSDVMLKRPLRDQDIPLPFRCGLELLHNLQNNVQLCLLLGTLALVIQQQVMMVVAKLAGAGSSDLGAKEKIGKLQKVLKRPGLGGGGQNSSNRDQNPGGPVYMTSFFNSCQQLFKDPKIERKSMLSQIEDKLMQLLIDCCVMGDLSQSNSNASTTDLLQSSFVREDLSSLAASILEQFSKVTEQGLEAPIHVLLIKRMRQALVPEVDDLALEMQTQTVVSDSLPNPVGLTFTFPERGQNPLTINAPDSESPIKQQQQQQQSSSSSGQSQSDSNSVAAASAMGIPLMMTGGNSTSNNMNQAAINPLLIDSNDISGLPQEMLPTYNVVTVFGPESKGVRQLGMAEMQNLNIVSLNQSDTNLNKSTNTVTGPGAASSTSSSSNDVSNYQNELSPSNAIKLNYKPNINSLQTVFAKKDCINDNLNNQTNVSGSLSPQALSPHAFPGPGTVVDPSPANSDRSNTSLSSAPSKTAMNHLTSMQLLKATLPWRPQIARAGGFDSSTSTPFFINTAMGDKPWLLSYAANELGALELRLARFVAANWLVYKSYYWSGGEGAM